LEIIAKIALADPCTMAVPKPRTTQRRGLEDSRFSR
jgi:hypothetical protein